MSRLPWNRVGSQFFVAQPGMDEDAKKNRMAQKAMLEKMSPKDFQMEAVSGDFSARPSALVEMTETGRASFHDADDTEPVEGLLPGQGRGQVGAEAAEGLAQVQAGHVDAHGEGARFSGMVVGDERQA